MKVAFDIDSALVIRNDRLNYAALLPVLNASKRHAEIIFHTESVEAAAELMKLLPRLNLGHGKTSLFFGRPRADLYLGV